MSIKRDMSVVQGYIDPNILNYLNENWQGVEVFGETYYWKRFNHFNMFLYPFEKLDIVSHEWRPDYRPPDMGADKILSKYKFWYKLNYDEFLEMINEVELFDKELSLDEKYKSIEQDF